MLDLIPLSFDEGCHTFMSFVTTDVPAGRTTLWRFAAPADRRARLAFVCRTDSGPAAAAVTVGAYREDGVAVKTFTLHGHAALDLTWVPREFWFGVDPGDTLRFDAVATGPAEVGLDVTVVLEDACAAEPA